MAFKEKINVERRKSVIRVLFEEQERVSQWVEGSMHDGPFALRACRVSLAVLSWQSVSHTYISAKTHTAR